MRCGLERRRGFVWSGKEGRTVWGSVSWVVVVGCSCGVVDESRSIGWAADGMKIDAEVEHSCFGVAAGVVADDAPGVLLAEAGRGGGCMGVCFNLEPREVPERARVGVCGSVWVMAELPFWASCASSSAR